MVVILKDDALHLMLVLFPPVEDASSGPACQRAVADRILFAIALINKGK